MSSADDINAYEFGEWIVEPHLNRIRRDGDDIQLEPRTLDVLRYLLDHAGEVVSIDELLDSVWADRIVEPNAVHRNVNRIRRALGDRARDPRYIETVPKRGYRTVAPVRTIDAAPHDADLAASLEALTPPYPAYEGDEPFTFVCYSHNDRAAVYRELVRLKAAGVNVWYDEGISPGAEWTEEVATAISNCTYFLIFVSPHSIASRHCLDELQYAQTRGKPLVVVYLDETDLPEGLQLSIGRVQALFKYSMPESAYARKLLSVLNRPPGSHENIPAPPSAVEANTTTGRRRGWLIAGATTSLVVALLSYLFRDTDLQTLITPTPPDSIHVQPFEDLTPSRDQDWIGGVIVSAVRIGLPKRGLTVVSDGSYRTVDEPDDAPTAKYRLTGSVSRLRNRLRVTVELISLENNNQVWSHVYHEILDAELSAQDVIATNIVRGVSTTVRGELNPTLVAADAGADSGAGALQGLLDDDESLPSFDSFDSFESFESVDEGASDEEASNE